jgi:hypothetical protein
MARERERRGQDRSVGRSERIKREEQEEHIYYVETYILYYTSGAYILQSKRSRGEEQEEHIYDRVHVEEHMYYTYTIHYRRVAYILNSNRSKAHTHTQTI